MKKLIILFIFTSGILLTFGQKLDDKKTETLIHKWELLQFEIAEKKGMVVTVTKTKYADGVSFEFKADQTLTVIYSPSKTENYFWKLKKKIIEISPADKENYNSEIVGVFEVPLHDKISLLFLQRRKDPHHGIMLKY